MATFGLDSGVDTVGDVSGYLSGGRHENTAGSGTLTQLELLCDDVSPTGTARLGIYADSAGSPGALLLDAGEVALGSGWISISGLSLEVTAGTYYWLAYKQSAANGTRRDTGGPADSNVWLSAGYGALPDPFGTPAGSDANRYVMRATVTAAGASITYPMLERSARGIERGILIGEVR